MEGVRKFQFVRRQMKRQPGKDEWVIRRTDGRGRTDDRPKIQQGRREGKEEELT